MKQDASLGAYYCKRCPQDGRIFWREMTDFQVHNLVRALKNIASAFPAACGEVSERIQENSSFILGDPSWLAMRNLQYMVGQLLSHVKLRMPVKVRINLELDSVGV